MTAHVTSWLIEPLAPDVSRSIELLAAFDDVERIAILPDVHLAKEVCVGTVLATTGSLLPDAVGGDIGCGMASLALDADVSLLQSEQAAARLLAGLSRAVPTNRHPRATMPVSLPVDLEQATLSDARLEHMKRRDARVQLGTLGRGNHFLEFQADEAGQLWITVHSGSRGIGQAISNYHRASARRNRGVAVLDAESDPGRAYLNDAQWAMQYAAENRLAMVSAVVDLCSCLFDVSPIPDSLIHSDHNHVRREMHFDCEYWVHRKGAQSANRGESGIVPGSMGTATYHVTGRGCDESLMSCSHGAGRQLSRGAARKAISRRQLERELSGVWFDHRAADLLRDEAPGAYKDVEAVMRAQRELVRIERRLRPLLVYKGGR